MTRKMIAERGGYFRDLLWTAAPRRQGFTCREMAKATGATPRTVQNIFGVWVKSGVLTYTSGKRGQRFYRIARDSAQTPCCPPRVTDSLWLAMKMSKVFTVADLVLFARGSGVQLSDKTAHSYCKHLACAGYLAVVHPSTPGCYGSKAVYRFVLSTGPRAPIITSGKQVFDSNLKKVMKPKEKNNDQ